MTTRRLVLIRHSKAVAGAADHDRPLADRGVADAAMLGRWLSAAGVTPDRVIVSTALRADQTWEFAAAAAAAAAWNSEVVSDARVYTNTVEALLEIIHEGPADVITLVLVGHNPSMAELAGGLDDGAGDSGARNAIARSYPTSGVACFDVTTSWDEVGLRTATVTHFDVPRA